jgi:3-isopropylmalate dehydrogenase
VAKIGVIAGDGVGPEVVAEALSIARIVAKARTIDWIEIPFDLGAERLLRDGSVLPDHELNGLRSCDAIFLGAVGDPRVAPGVLEKGLLLRLRFELGLYINLRPVKLYPGVETPLKDKGPAQIDFVVVRENNEDLYVGAGGVARLGTAEEVAIQTSINTRAGVERCVRFALELTRSRAKVRPFPGLSPDAASAGKRGRLTLVAKTNVLTYAHDLWMRVFQEVGRAYDEIELDYQHVDAACMRMVTNPERFDVIVTTNMFGDILTDLGAVLQGGMGVASSGNLNPERTTPSMFEPVHGSAPDIAGKGVANPVAAMLSIAMLFEHLEQPDAAGDIRGAVESVLRAGRTRTPDLGGTDSTATVGRAVRDALGDGPSGRSK